MDIENSDLLVMALGAGGAILLGMVLVPFRGLTPAANFSFCFVILIVLVAEFGGRRAAVVTALVSALSLDFFLTQPYLTLAITDKHDVVAFLGLAACGLVAAMFRGQRATQAVLSRDLSLLDAALPAAEATEPLEPALGRAFELALRALPLSDLVLRDLRGKTMLATPGAAARPPAVLSLNSATLRPEGAAAAPMPFPGDGGRVALRAANQTVGYLDVWGSGRTATDADRMLLSLLARTVALRLATHAEPMQAAPQASLPTTI